MALDADRLGLAIASTIISKSIVLATPEMVTNIQQFWKDVAADMVGEMQDNAEVPSGIPVSTTGTEAAQSGSTTGAGKVQ